MRFRRYAALTALAGAGMAAAQNPTQFHAHVQDSGGAEMHRVSALVTGSSVIARRALTDQHGNFDLLGWLGGDYQITLSSRGFADLQVKGTLSEVTLAPLVMYPVTSGGPMSISAENPKWEYGVQASGGVGLEDRTNFSFLNAGGHAGRVLTPNFGNGVLRANFEYGVEVIPFWQSYTPKFQKLNCPAGATVASQCKGPTTSGGTYHGVSIVPIQLRFNFTHGQRVMPWIQGAGGVLYTTRKYPGIGNLNVGDPTMTGPAADTSVWNFTPQGGVGMHYFLRLRRSLDFNANAVHISSASLGDKNPGVNTSVQFAVGYSWWK